MTDLLDLGGRNAVVTGAGQGVGRQIALHLAGHGAGTVVVNDLFEDRAKATCEAVRAAGGEAESAVFDISDWTAVQEAAERMRQSVGDVDILVNNAGIPPERAADQRLFADTGPDDWRPWFDVNVLGTMQVTRTFVPGMVERGWGRVVTIISDAGRVGEPRLAAYGAAKAAAAGFSRCLAKEVGAAGVTVNCVALGGIKTEAMAAMLGPEIEAKALKRYTIKRLGTAEDPANMVLFLVSEAAAWITGQTYPVNGGYSFAV